MKFSQMHLGHNSVVFIAIICLFASSGLARETYSSFAARIMIQAQSEHDIRTDLEAELLRLANAYRVSQNLPSLRADTANKAAARAHAMDMMIGNFMGHVASTGHDFESRMRALRPGVMVLPAMAENAARVTTPGTVDKAMAARLFQQWIKSAPHRHTLRSLDYVAVATGVVSKGGVLYADQIFLGPEMVTNMGGAVPEIRGGGLY